MPLAVAEANADYLTNEIHHLVRDCQRRSQAGRLNAVESWGAFVRATIEHDCDNSILTFDRALEMNPNSALALGFSAIVSSFSDRYERANEHALKALRLSPFDPLNYHPYAALAIACFFTGRLENSVTNSALAVHVNPTFSFLQVFLVAGQAGLGHLDAAHVSARRLLTTAPDFTIGSFVRAGFVRPQLMERLAAELRKAGLPE